MAGSSFRRYLTAHRADVLRVTESKAVIKVPQSAQTTDLDGPMEVGTVDAITLVMEIGIGMAMDHAQVTAIQNGMEDVVETGAMEGRTGKYLASIESEHSSYMNAGAGMPTATMLAGSIT
jgi:hypothetical protein